MHKSFFKKTKISLFRILLQGQTMDVNDKKRGEQDASQTADFTNDDRPTSWLYAR